MQLAVSRMLAGCILNNTCESKMEVPVRHPAATQVGPGRAESSPAIKFIEEMPWTAKYLVELF